MSIGKVESMCYEKSYFELAFLLVCICQSDYHTRSGMMNNYIDGMDCGHLKAFHLLLSHNHHKSHSSLFIYC